MWRSPGIAGTPFYSSEIELLLRAARVSQTTIQATRIADLAVATIDWAFVLREAARHGVLPLLHLHLHSHPAVPSAVRAQLHARTQASAARSLLLTGELLQLLPLFAAHDVAALPFKGPTLAAQAYGNVALREFGDLDLLVPEAALPRAKAILLQRGYRVQYRVSPRREAAYLHTIGQLPFRHDNGCVVELHTTLAPRSFVFPLHAAQLWQRRATVCLLGQSVPAPGREDLLLILCMHGAKHQWNALGWVCDVAELVQAGARFDWAATLQRARHARSRRMLFLGLALAQRLLRLGLPAEVEMQLRTDSAVGRLARRICRQMLASSKNRDREGAQPIANRFLAGAPLKAAGRASREESKTDGLSSLWFHLWVRERLGDGLRYCCSLVLEPTPADWDREPAPGWLPFADHLRRFFRLVAKYGRAAYQRVIGKITNRPL
jgi:hypothetical protein